MTAIPLRTMTAKNDLGTSKATKMATTAKFDMGTLQLSATQLGTQNFTDLCVQSSDARVLAHFARCIGPRGSEKPAENQMKLQELVAAMESAPKITPAEIPSGWTSGASASRRCRAPSATCPVRR